MVGPTAKYRQHDGSGNNPSKPEMGKAGSPYARNVPSAKPKGPNLPDPELVYDQLLKRKGDFRPHPSGLNRLFFSFATVVIHECFQTSRTDSWINETSSYVDLSTIYGNTGKEQKRVRTYQNGTIYPDSSKWYPASWSKDCRTSQIPYAVQQPIGSKHHSPVLKLGY